MDVTEVVRYLVGPTERQSKDIPSLNSRISSTESVGSGHQLETGAPGHDGAVVERSADGRAAVVGHGSQQEALSCGVHHKEGHLDHAALGGDGPVRGQKVDQQLGCDHRGVTDMEEREGAEKELHGTVEAGVREDERRHPQVAHHGHGVDGQEASEEKLLEVWVIGESQQDEVGDGGVVSSGKG